MLKTIRDPNFSIVVPGGCNARCPFCFWNPNTFMGLESEYLKRLKYVLDRLPKQFQQISLTGGEPTISPLCDGILNMIDKKRFPKVVLSTNGTQADLFGLKNIRKIDHINISRHAVDDKENYKIFGTYSVPSAKVLKVICDGLNRMGIDVCLSVVQHHFHQSDVRPFIDFAKKIGASSICFRKIHGPKSSLAPTPAEKYFSSYAPIYQSGCPACRSQTNIIDGMTVVWKASMYEPSTVMKEIYELIFQPGGSVTADWEATKRVYKLDELVEL